MLGSREQEVMVVERLYSFFCWPGASQPWQPTPASVLTMHTLMRSLPRTSIESLWGSVIGRWLRLAFHFKAALGA